jgi:tetratricopeptide (TPR) repeat protein
MKRTLVLIHLLAAASLVSGQKSRVLAVFQMIDAQKYEEAKEAIEQAAWNEKTSRWPRTYHAKGVLCQTAYEEGIKKKDPKLTDLYPDQLYVAYYAYERALVLDVRERLYPSISQRYYHLSNDFRMLGEELYGKKEYEKSLRAFENAILVNQSKLIQAKVDTNLIYNTAMAAYECRNWNKAIGYLSGLHKAAHAPSTSQLLFHALCENGDSVQAEKVLQEGVQLFDYEEQVVVNLVHQYVQKGRMEQALSLLEEALVRHPGNYRFWWGEGMIYSQAGRLDDAIKSLTTAIGLAPGEAKIYYHLGIVYYNKGIDLMEASLDIRENDTYLEMREQSRKEFLEALAWMERSYEIDPLDEETLSSLHQLYNQLQVNEKWNR